MTKSILKRAKNLNIQIILPGSVTYADKKKRSYQNAGSSKHVQ